MEFLEIFVAFVVVSLCALFAARKFSANKATRDGAGNGNGNATATAASTVAGDKKSKVSPSAASSSSALIPMSIFFGSQSGTAETFANELADECRLYGFKGTVVDLESYDRDELASEKYAVFLIATFGEGEPTDNSAEFMEWIKNSEESLNSVPFAVFALGNRQYEHFCAVGRELDSRLAALGGSRVCDLCEGDDDGSLDEDFSHWKTQFWAATNALFGTKAIDAELKAVEAKKFESSYSLIYVNKAELNYNGGLNNLLTDPKHRVVKSKCVENRELRTQTGTGTGESADPDFGSTRHIEFDLSGLKLNYLTADNLGVYPRNDESLARQLISTLGFDSDQLFRAKAKPGKKSPFPSPCSILDAFTWYLDFQSTPRLPQLTILMQFTKSDEGKDKLHSWTHEAKEEYLADHKSWREIFEEIPDCRPPLPELLDLVPKLAPRYYTISSSSLVQPTVASITVSLMIHRKSRGRITRGICSDYLIRLSTGDLAAIFVRPSTFRFPKHKTANQTEQKENESVKVSPMIMCGPGTGLAPFRGFLHEAEYLKARGIPVGQMILYFGCKQRDRDFIYREELEAAKEKGILSQLHLAFSRDQQKKVYVQDLMSEHGEVLWKLIFDEKANIFLCGGTSMGRSVRERILSLAREHGAMNDKAAEEFLKKIQSEKKFIQELWS